MPNYCTRIIDSGPRMGSVCNEVSLRCRHDAICPHCDKSYASRHSFHKHLAICASEQPPADTSIAPMLSIEHTLNQIMQMQMETSQQIKNLATREFVEEKIQQVLVSGTAVATNLTSFDVNLSCYRSMGEDIYAGLVDKFGEPETVSYVKETVGRKRPMDLFQKLYLEGYERHLYPVVTNGTQMRYVDCRRMLVSDENGQMLAYLIQESIQNALLKTASYLINAKLKYEEECSESNMLCDEFTEVQYAALDLKRRLPRTEIVCILKEWTTFDIDVEAQHPFFDNVSCVKATEQKYTPTAEAAAANHAAASLYKKRSFGPMVLQG